MTNAPSFVCMHLPFLLELPHFSLSPKEHVYPDIPLSIVPPHLCPSNGPINFHGFHSYSSVYLISEDLELAASNWREDTFGFLGIGYLIQYSLS